MTGEDEKPNLYIYKSINGELMASYVQKKHNEWSELTTKQLSILYNVKNESKSIAKKIEPIYLSFYSILIEDNNRNLPSRQEKIEMKHSSIRLLPKDFDYFLRNTLQNSFCLFVLDDGTKFACRE